MMKQTRRYSFQVFEPKCYYNNKIKLFRLFIIFEAVELQAASHWLMIILIEK
jgi:hypothetical protein